MDIQIGIQKNYFLVIKSIGGHPWKLFIFNYYTKCIHFEVKEKLGQEKSLIFRLKDLKFWKKLAEEVLISQKQT